MEYWSIGVLGNEIVWGLHNIGIGRLDFEIERRNESRGTTFFAEWAAFPEWRREFRKGTLDFCSLFFSANAPELLNSPSLRLRSSSV
jgi:hypothetical protein